MAGDRATGPLIRRQRFFSTTSIPASDWVAPACTHELVLFSGRPGVDAASRARVKTIAVQAVASLHRLRSAWLATSTARLNTIRGLLREFVLFIPVGASKVVPPVRTLLAEPRSEVPDSLRPLLEGACDEIGRIGPTSRRRTAADERRPQVAAVPVLQTIPGIGVLTATALVGDTHRFPSGRHFASFLG